MQRVLMSVFLIAVVGISGCQSGPPVAASTERSPDQDYQDGEKALKASNFSEAARYFHGCAAAGHGGCMIYLGRMYQSGSYLDKDVAEAMRWAKSAAALKKPFGLAQTHGSLAVAAYFCEYPQLGGSYALVQQWSDRVEVELAKALDLDYLSGEEFDSIVADIEQRLFYLKSAHRNRTCKF